MYCLQKSLCCSPNSHLKTVALSGMSASSQIARRLSPSAMRLQIESPSSVVNNDGRPAGRFRGFMGLDQFGKGAHLPPYYARRLCGARVRPQSVPSPSPDPGPNRDSSPELRLGSAQCTREAAGGDRKRVVRGGGALSGIARGGVVHRGLRGWQVHAGLSTRSICAQPWKRPASSPENGSGGGSAEAAGNCCKNDSRVTLN